MDLEQYTTAKTKPTLSSGINLRQIADRANIEKGAKREKELAEQYDAVLAYCKEQASNGLYEARWTKALARETVLALRRDGIKVEDCGEQGERVSYHLYNLTW
jgi:hypothetical protein